MRARAVLLEHHKDMLQQALTFTKRDLHKRKGIADLNRTQKRKLYVDLEQDVENFRRILQDASRLP